MKTYVKYIVYQTNKFDNKKTYRIILFVIKIDQ